jgi:exodeoxyribonuclease VII large subunit
MPADEPNSGEGDAAAGRPYTVSEITAQVKAALEESLPMCWVVGEISQFTRHTSGHHYFTLKDEASQLSAVMFKWQARGLAFTPEPGMQVMAYGHVSVYERGGRYQFYVAQMQPAGVGELALAFERLRNRLEAEGLFDPEHKRALPPYPQAIGVVTSATGAAIRDIVNVLQRRAPGLQIVLRPARVQGAGAAEEIARGIADLNRYPGMDILIVGRGGGAPEDLWPFNEELVARAIYQSEKPIISAVGHEIDYTIADYVADRRAPTPSAAAELVAQEHGGLQLRTVELRQRLHKAVDSLLAYHGQRLRDMDPQRLRRRLQGRLDQASQHVDERCRDLATAFDWYMHRRSGDLRSAATRLEDLNPLAGLARGFALCERLADGRLVRSGSDLEAGDKVRLRFRQGSAVATVEEISNE